MTDDPILEPSALERLLEITGGDLEFLDELIDTFLDDAQVQMAALRDAVAGDDPEAYVRPAHSLKSNAANVGAMGLATLSRDLEAAGRTGILVDGPDRVEAIERALEAARAALLQDRADR